MQHLHNIVLINDNNNAHNISVLLSKLRYRTILKKVNLPANDQEPVLKYKFLKENKKRRKILTWDRDMQVDTSYQLRR